MEVGPLLFTVINTWKMFLLKMGQMLLQSESICIIKWGSFPYYKWGRLYYKLHQVLQSEAKYIHVFIAYVDDIAVKSTISIMSSKMRSINQ